MDIYQSLKYVLLIYYAIFYVSFNVFNGNSVEEMGKTTYWCLVRREWEWIRNGGWCDDYY